MKIEIDHPHGFSNLGMKPNNEDSVFPQINEATTEDSLFLVCDGVGGRDKGEVASAVLCETLSKSFPRDFEEMISPSDFKTALAKVYDRLNKLEDPDVVYKMGSTLTFLKFHSGGAMIAHIGDSRVYHIRTTSNHPILYKTEDHSLVATLVKAGMITIEEAAVHPKRNIIHRAVQPNQKEPADADIYETTDLLPGDYFFMCSDGVLENLTDEKLVEILLKDNSVKSKIDEIERICEGRTHDNYSAWLIRISNVSGNFNLKTNEVFVLKEVLQAPIPVEKKTMTEAIMVKTRKYAWVLTIVVLAIIFIVLRAYQKKISNGHPIQNDTTIRINSPLKEISPISVPKDEIQNEVIRKDKENDKTPIQKLQPKAQVEIQSNDTIGKNAMNKKTKSDAKSNPK